MKFKSLIIFLIVALLSVTGLSLCACEKEENEPSSNPLVTIELLSGEIIRLELYPEIAPITVENFIKYAEDGYYTGTVFHRVIADFMIQGGGYTLRNESLVHKQPTYEAISGEFAENKFENTLKHEPGVISMARTADVNSATSQFFICTEMSAAQRELLDGHYAAFGKVTDSASLNIVTRLSKVQTGTYEDDYLGKFENFPLTAVTIGKVTVKR